MLKRCSRCKEEKIISEFYKDRTRKDGIADRCKDCQKVLNNANGPKYYAANKELIKEKNRVYRAENVEKIKESRARRYDKKKNYEQCKNYRLNNPEKIKVIVSRWYKNNAAKANVKTAKRRAMKNNATPSWLTSIHKAQIQEFYDLAIARSMQTGIDYQVDHIHPLNGKTFSGLHVPWNMQILTAAENAAKSNKLIEGE